MPRFMGFVRMEEGIGAPPQALFDAMDAYIGEQAAKGVFLDGGGLFGTEDAVNFVVRKGETSRVDGPYAEAKEVVGGFAILRYDTLEEAVAGQEEFADLHAKYWPECSMVATLRQISEEPPAAADESSIAVVGSGNLGLVWFTGNDHRLTVEELEALHPGLIASVAAHPGVAMLMVRSAEHGAVVFGPKGTRYLDQDRVEGEDPAALFGPNTVMSLKREDAMTHAPDLLLLSQYNPDLGEVAAFEELIGSHGGLGGPQTEPFILHPVEWELDEAVPLGAPAVYRNIRRWLESIGIGLGPQPKPAPAPAEPAAEPAAAGS